MLLLFNWIIYKNEDFQRVLAELILLYCKAVGRNVTDSRQKISIFNPPESRNGIKS